LCLAVFLSSVLYCVYWIFKAFHLTVWKGKFRQNFPLNFEKPHPKSKIIARSIAQKKKKTEKEKQKTKKFTANNSIIGKKNFGNIIFIFALKNNEQINIIIKKGNFLNHQQFYAEQSSTFYTLFYFFFFVVWLAWQLWKSFGFLSMILLPKNGGNLEEFLEF
jgi:hypothetical protein